MVGFVMANTDRVLKLEYAHTLKFFDKLIDYVMFAAQMNGTYV